MLLDPLSKPFGAALPRQMVSLKTKMENKNKFGVPKWARQTIDSLEGIGRYQFMTNAYLQDNYDIAEGNFRINHYIDSNDMYDFVSAVSQEFQVPNFLKHYDITGKAVKLLTGEFLKRPDVFHVVDKSEEASNQRLAVKDELTKTYFNQAITQGINEVLQMRGVDVNRNEFKNEEEQSEYKAFVEAQYQELAPESIDKYMRYTYRNTAELWGEGTLVTLKDKFYLREKEMEEFKDTMITGRVCCHFRPTVDGFDVNRWRPQNIFYDQSPEVKWWQDGDYAGRVFFDSKARVIDTYGFLMTNEEKEAMYPDYVKNTATDKGVMKEFFSASLYPFSDYRDFATTTDALGFEPLTGQPVGGAIPQFTDRHMANYLGYKGWNFSQTDLVQVTECYWRSYRKIGQLLLLNPDTGEPEIHWVDETFDAKLFGVEEIEDKTFEDKEQPVNSVIWTWHTQIWQGIKINTNYSKEQDKEDGSAMYLAVKPVDFQFKGEYHPLLRPKLPICGIDFGKMVVDLLKPYQLLYNVLFNQSYELIQRNNGRFLLMDMAFLPMLKDNGGDDAIEKAMLVAKSLGFMPVDSRIQNMQGTPAFAQNQVVDLDDTPKIERLINLAMLIEQQAFIQIGITPQRQGQVQASETAYGTETAKAQSFAITEPYFENFYSYKKRKLQMMLDMAQFLQSQDKIVTLRYTTSDMAEQYVKITGTELYLADLGVDVDYSAETMDRLRMAKQIALENNTMGLSPSKLIDIIKLNNLNDIQRSLEAWEEQQQKQKQAEMEQEKEIAQMNIEAQAADKQADRDLKKYEIDTKAQTEIQKVTLQSIGNEGSYDTENNTLDQLTAERDHILENRKLDADIATKQFAETNKLIDSFRKGKQEEKKLASEKKLKESEAKWKKETEQEKLKQIEKQNVSQEKMQNKKIEGDLKLVKEKSKAEKEKAELAKELLDKKIEMEEAKVEGAKKKNVEEVKQIINKTAVEKRIGDTKASVEQKVGQAKVDEVKTLTNVKKEEAKKLSSLKIDVAKDDAKTQKVINKKKGQIKLRVQDIVGKQKISDASKKKNNKK